MRLKIIDRYIIKEFLFTLAGIFFMVSVVLLAYILMDSYSDIIENKPAFSHVCLFFALSLPFLIFQAVPMIIGMATVFSIGNLSRKKETLVMITSGISPVRIAVPLLILGVLLSISAFYFNEIIVPWCEGKAKYILQVHIEGKNSTIVTRNQDIFVKGKGSRFYIMKGFDSSKNVMTKPIILDADPKGSFLLQKIEAEQAELIKTPDGKNAWRFTGYIRHSYNDKGKLLNIDKSEGTIDVLMEDNLEKFLSQRKKAEEMNYSELREYLDILYQRGETNHNLATDLQMKLSFPLACLIVMIIGYSFAIKAQISTFIYSIGQGIGLIMLYYALVLLCQGLGHHGVLVPMLAAWTPNAIFLSVGTVLLTKQV